ncbi:hypothetical protein [Mycolicibacterium vaccae]|uniref:hypothetical protein n=1 Tax=Mycolicibacterium vaccae TaxID=1810 RepID=UPI003D041CA0
MSQLALPSCVLPGCSTPVGVWGDVCGGCRDAFGPLLRHNPDGELLTQAAIEDRDTQVRAAYQKQRTTR